MLPSLHDDVSALATAERAKASARFFKTGPGQYGEGDQFAGLSLPQIRGLVRKYRDLSLEDTEQLLHSEVHEERSIAVLILVDRYKRSRRDPATQERIYDLYLANTAYVNNWDLVDASAEHIVGPYLEDKPRDVLFKLAASHSLWERRIALLASFHYIKQGDPTTTLQLAEALLNDKQDLIHKALCWMLREAGKRCGTEVLTGFLDRHAATMPRTALRYALEHLDPETRVRYMAMKANSNSAASTRPNSD